MKKIVIVVIGMLILGINGKAQDFVADFVEKQTDMADFTQVNISAKMFQLVADITDEEVNGIIQNLTGMRIITIDRDVEKYFKEVKQMLAQRISSYECLMNVKEEKEEVWMYVRDVKGKIAELVIVVVDSGEFVLMNFSGEIDLKKIAGLTKAVKINGMEYLNKVDDSARNKPGK